MPRDTKPRAASRRTFVIFVLKPRTLLWLEANMTPGSMDHQMYRVIQDISPVMDSPPSTAFLQSPSPTRRFRTGSSTDTLQILLSTLVRKPLQSSLPTTPTTTTITILPSTLTLSLLFSVTERTARREDGQPLLARVNLFVKHRVQAHPSSSPTRLPKRAQPREPRARKVRCSPGASTRARRAQQARERMPPSR